MSKKAAPYTPKPGDIVKPAGFDKEYRVVSIGPCPHQPPPGGVACTVPAILIYLPDPPHPLWAWLNKLVGRPVRTARLTWVHARRAEPAGRVTGKRAPEAADESHDVEDLATQHA